MLGRQGLVGRAVGGFRQDMTAPVSPRPVRRLTALAEEKGIKVTQLALAWLLHQGEDIVPIPGTRRPERLEENAASVDVTLSDDDLARIDQIVPDGAYGGRYAEGMTPEWV